MPRTSFGGMKEYRKIWFQKHRTIDDAADRTAGLVFHRPQFAKMTFADLSSYFPYSEAGKMKYLCMTAPSTEEEAFLSDTPERTMRVNL